MTIYSRLQQGFALISVLIILIVITLLGITAMRMGLSSLSIATNSQAAYLLFQSADMGTRQLVANASSDVTAALDTTGILHIGRNNSYCVTPVTGTAYPNLTAGNCNAANDNHYLSKRAVVLTQVTYSRVNKQGTDTNSAQVGLGAPKDPNAPSTGSSTGNAFGSYPEEIRVFSTSVIPDFGSATKDEINACLQKPADDEDDRNDITDMSNSNEVTITDCLTDLGAVFTTHVSKYEVVR